MPFDPNTFNAAKFLYYNPELTASSNIVSNTQAYDWARSNDTSGMASNDASIPEPFNCEVFISDYKKTLNASALNKVIRASMLAEGFTQTDLNRRAKYVNNIFHDVHIIDSNVFKFNPHATTVNDTFYISDKSLSVGDSVKLLNKITNVYEFATVSNIIDNETILVSNPKKHYTNIGDMYICAGIKMFDVSRIAKINFIRGLDPAPNVPPANALTYIDPEFNPDLYRLLYPETSKMTDLEAYYDYINNVDSMVKRIGRVSDIPLDPVVFTPDFDYLHINYRLELAKNAGFQFGTMYVYGISQDSVIHSKFINKAHDHLISEWAMKKYVDRKFDELAVFNDVVVNGLAIFNGPVEFMRPIVTKDLTVDGQFVVNLDSHLIGNLVVDGTTHLNNGTFILGTEPNYIENVLIHNTVVESGAIFKTDVYLESNVFFEGYVMGPRLGIGFPPHSVSSLSNISNPQSNITNSLQAINNTLTANEIIAIKTEMSNVSSQLSNLSRDQAMLNYVLEFGDTTSNLFNQVSNGWIVSNTDIYFSTSSNVFAGNVGIGLSNPAYKLQVNGSIFCSESFITPSDNRYKDDIETISGALDKVCRLSGYTYTRRDLSDKRRRTGLLAQEVDAVIPEVVFHDQDGMMSVSYGEMAGLFVQAIKELNTKLDRLNDSRVIIPS
jgi:hypothetical protein